MTQTVQRSEKRRNRSSVLNDSLKPSGSSLGLPLPTIPSSLPSRKTEMKARHRNSHHDTAEANKESWSRSHPSKSVKVGSSTFTYQETVPAFINKLFHMVQDPATNDLIRWSETGTSFLVEQYEQFSEKVLPRFFKHTKFASFVRQLNMYCFYKVASMAPDAATCDRQNERLEFSNPYFCRDRPGLLPLITRKNKGHDLPDSQNTTCESLADEVRAIRKYQKALNNNTAVLRDVNDTLWQETLSAREKHQRQSDAVGKIVQFLTTVFKNSQTAMNQASVPRTQNKHGETHLQTTRKQETHKPGSPGDSTVGASAGALLSDHIWLIEEAMRLAGMKKSTGMQLDTFERSRLHGSGSKGFSELQKIHASLSNILPNAKHTKRHRSTRTFTKNGGNMSRYMNSMTSLLDTVQDKIQQASGVGNSFAQYSHPKSRVDDNAMHTNADHSKNACLKDLSMNPPSVVSGKSNTLDQTVTNSSRDKSLPNGGNLSSVDCPTAAQYDRLASCSPFPQPARQHEQPTAANIGQAMNLTPIPYETIFGHWQGTAAYHETISMLDPILSIRTTANMGTTAGNFTGSEMGTSTGFSIDGTSGHFPVPSPTPAPIPHAIDPRMYMFSSPGSHNPDMQHLHAHVPASLPTQMAYANGIESQRVMHLFTPSFRAENTPQFWNESARSQN